MLATIRSETNPHVDELAASLTEVALEVLRQVGVDGDSIEVELELWRALTAGLEREAHWRWTRRLAAESPLDSFLAQVIHRAALEVAAAFTPDRLATELDLRIRPRVDRLRFTPSLRKLAGRVFTPKEDPSPRPLGASGLYRKFRVTALN